MTSKDPLDEEIRGLTGRLAHARDSLEKGTVPDLAPLMPTVTRLCREIEGRPPAEAQELKTALLTVIEELDCLETALKSGLDEVKGQIGEAADRRRAADAYARR
jgi:hypothetical protein